MDELKKSIEAHNVLLQLNVETLGQAESLIKGGVALPIGTIKEWSGKKYKKQANGKWVEISDDKRLLSKKEHEAESIKAKKRGLHEDYSKYHDEKGSKLSDKEHEDHEIGAGNIQIGQVYKSPAPEGGESINFKITSIKDGKYTIETSNKEGRKGEHTFDEKIMNDLVNGSELIGGKPSPKDNSDSISIKSAYGDFKFSSKKIATNLSGEFTKPENYSVLEMKDGSFVRTTNNRASKFEKQGDGKIIGKFMPDKSFKEMSS